MASQSHLLIDARESIVRDGALFDGGSKDASAPKWAVRLRTCRGGRSEGVHVVEIDNGHMTIDVLPTRGMGIWRVRRNPLPSPSRGRANSCSILGWQSPARDPVHPAFVPLMEPSGLGWLDGFNELLCRCGLESNGPPEFDGSGRLVRPLHGRIANTPAHFVELLVDEDAGRLTLRGVVDESRFHFQSLRLTASISTTIGSNEFTWNDEVENIGGRDATLQMLYHFNLGQPLLQPGTQISAPVAIVSPQTVVAAREALEKPWNVVPPPRPGSAEQVYFLELLTDENNESRVLASGLAGGDALSLRFNKRTLPCFTVWRNTPAEADGYVLGLEPGTNYPNPRSMEKQRGRVIILQPGQAWCGAVTATWHDSRQSIAEEEALIRAMQAGREPELTGPGANWSVDS